MSERYERDGLTDTGWKHECVDDRNDDDRYIAEGIRAWGALTRITVLAMKPEHEADLDWKEVRRLVTKAIDG